MTDRTWRLGWSALSILLAAGMLTGCFLDDDNPEDCGASSYVGSMVGAGCIEPPTECRGDRARGETIVLVARTNGLSDHDLVDPGTEIRVQSTDVEAVPARATLLVRTSEQADATTHRLRLGQHVAVDGTGYRLAEVCDSNVAYLVRVG